MKLSVISPARNEEANIGKTIEEIYGYLSGKGIEHEIIVIENNSTDKTVEAVKSLSSGIPTLSLVHLVIKGTKPAKGFAVRTGLLRATGDIRLFTDADNSTSIDHIEKMLPYFDKGYEVIIGSIGVKGAVVYSGSEQGWRRLFGKMGNLFIQIMAVPGISDTQRGFKMFSAGAVNKIFPKITIFGWGFDVEVLALARKYGYKIKEVPINWNNDTTNSKVSLRSYFQVLMETIKVRGNLLTGLYDKPVIVPDIIVEEIF